MSGLGLGGGRENRLRQFLGLDQPGRQFDPANSAVAAVLGPRRTGDVAARHAFDQDRLGAVHQHAAVAQLVRVGAGGQVHIGHVGTDQVVGDDVAGALEPEGR